MEINKKLVILDTDPGQDDFLTIIAAACDPHISLIGIVSVFGNTDIENTTHNVLGTLSLIKKDIPVFKGSSKARERGEMKNAFFHGLRGLEDVTLPSYT